MQEVKIVCSFAVCKMQNQFNIQISIFYDNEIKQAVNLTSKRNSLFLVRLRIYFEFFRFRHPVPLSSVSVSGLILDNYYSPITVY